MNKVRFSHIALELQTHFPYTALSVATGLVFLGMLNFITTSLGATRLDAASADLFHVFHPLHMLFSTVATTAMFWRHERKAMKAIVVGVVGSIGICGISDIALPYISGMLLGVKMTLHICILKHPGIIIPFVFMGLIVGFVVPPKVQSTIFSHAAHVWISSMASILYLVSFGLADWVHSIGMVFVYMILAVVIPCCTSDIVFPLLCTHQKHSSPHH